ncbi:MAG: 30S ribosomal protein S9 [Candidatus Micrarchaeota archaeon]
MAVKKTSRKKKAQVVTRGKRKRAIARASIKPGSGLVRVNSQLLSSIQNPFFKAIAGEALNFVDCKGVDISVSVNGGGVMGQAQAVRTAIARALVDHFKDEKLKEEMIAFDRSLLVEDSRRVEPKKFLGPKARARFTKSYR